MPESHNQLSELGQPLEETAVENGPEFKELARASGKIRSLVVRQVRGLLPGGLGVDSLLFLSRRESSQQSLLYFISNG